MKKILALVSFLLVAAACTDQPATNTSTNSNANTATTTKLAAPSESELIFKEKAVWDSLKAKDYAAFGNMLTSDYVQVTDQGVVDKASMVADVKDFIPTDVTYSNWKMVPVDNDAAILTYNLTVKATYKGNAIPPGPYRAAAAWVNRDGKWLACYYQQTPVKEMPPPPPPAKTSPTPSKTEKPPATPLAKPAETGPDPIANEKIVWDILRSKNYDAFAAVLDPALVDLESTGVYDKAGAVKGVAEVDWSMFELGEWKSARLNDDAALVTYVVKLKDAKWDTARHTSIWAKRNGKWVSLLHVSTPVAKPAAK